MSKSEEHQIREKWQAWNRDCHPEDRIDWIEFYEEWKTSIKRK